MKAKANYLNKTFGLLKVMECVEASSGTNKGGLWLCKCKCRRTITLGGYQLHSRDSCGCLGRKAAIERGKSLQKSAEEKLQGKLYRDYKKSAISILSKAEWLKIVSEPCVYCSFMDDNQPVMSDSKIVSCCKICRVMRDTMSHSQFCKHVERINSYRK